MNRNLLFVDKQNGFLCYKTTAEDIEEAHRRYDILFHDGNILNDHTAYDKTEGKLAGALGEIVFERIYPESIQSEDWAYDYTLKGSKIDVKCKCRGVPPFINHDASMFSYQADNSEGKVDYYIFMSTTKTFERVWVCGFISRERLLAHEKLREFKAGETDGSNGMQFIKDTLCIKHRYLQQIGGLNGTQNNMADGRNDSVC